MEGDKADDSIQGIYCSLFMTCWRFKSVKDFVILFVVLSGFQVSLARKKLDEAIKEKMQIFLDLLTLTENLRTEFSL